MSEELQTTKARLDRRLEIWGALLLAAATVMVAWAAYQSAKWSGVQTDNYSRANAARVEAARASTAAGQETVVDVDSFIAWLNALATERQVDPDASRAPDGSYVPTDGVLSGYIFERFRPEFRPAVTAWLALRPLDDPSAPATPFDLPEYTLAASRKAARLDAQAEDFASAARRANSRSDNYVLVTILFASVMFFAGVASKMHTRRAQLFLLLSGLVIFVGASAVMLSFPKRF